MLTTIFTWSLVGVCAVVALLRRFKLLLWLPDWWAAVVLAVVIITNVFVPQAPYDGPYTGEEPAVMLSAWGGASSDVYLGCLNCSPRDADSVANENGAYGRADGRDSLYNRMGAYGSHDAAGSACSQYPLYPPQVKDPAGNFYGYLTVDEHRHDATKVPGMAIWLRYAACGYPLTAAVSTPPGTPPAPLASRSP